jgi:hypothetical protein
LIEDILRGIQACTLGFGDKVPLNLRCSVFLEQLTGAEIIKKSEFNYFFPQKPSSSGPDEAGTKISQF